MKKKWILWLAIPLGIFLLMAIVAVFILQPKRYSLTMTIHGDTRVAVELGQPFEDPGAEAQGHDLLHGESPVTVLCKGNVDTQTPGIYRLHYQAVFHGKICTAYRDVYVLESLFPVITLFSDPSTYTLPNGIYQEEGFSATDWYDGDLTAQVQRSIDPNAITYTVTNSMGLTTTVRRQIHYDDPIPPVIHLDGDTELTVPAGKPFHDPGFRATDNADGDLTEHVQVDGTVDIYRPGVYPITYTVWDHWGNCATVTRTVTVELNIPNPNSSEKIIYLTFDDGPGQYTEQLLDTLAKYNVKASFFLVNTGSISIAKRIADEGHTVAIHTATHRYSQIYISEEAYFKDLYRMQSIIADITGETTYLMRFPGGSSNVVSKNYKKGIMSALTKSVVDEGFYYFDWNVDSKDAGGATTAEEVFENVTKGIEKKNVAVVLQLITWCSA